MTSPNLGFATFFVPSLVNFVRRVHHQVIISRFWTLGIRIHDSIKKNHEKWLCTALHAFTDLLVGMTPSGSRHESGAADSGRGERVTSSSNTTPVQ